jgi:hypothetical protein
MTLARHLTLGLALAGGLMAPGTPAVAQTQTRAAKAVAAAAPASAAAQDQADLDKSQIIGNRELPKVLYIVPWKKPGPGDLSGRPLTSVMDEALSPVDRDVFRRQVNYDTQTTAKAAAAPAAAAPAK